MKDGPAWRNAGEYVSVRDVFMSCVFVRHSSLSPSSRPDSTPELSTKTRKSIKPRAPECSERGGISRSEIEMLLSCVHTHTVRGGGVLYCVKIYGFSTAKSNNIISSSSPAHTHDECNDTRNVRGAGERNTERGDYERQIHRHRQVMHAQEQETCAYCPAAPDRTQHTHRHGYSREAKDTIVRACAHNSAYSNVQQTHRLTRGHTHTCWRCQSRQHTSAAAPLSLHARDPPPPTMSCADSPLRPAYPPFPAVCCCLCPPLSPHCFLAYTLTQRSQYTDPTSTYCRSFPGALTSGKGVRDSG